MKIFRIITAKKSVLELLKENKVKLTEEERKKCIETETVWHHGPNGEESPAIWKGKDSNGDIWFVTNTHRAWRKSKTLKGAIIEFHDFIKETA